MLEWLKDQDSPASEIVPRTETLPERVSGPAGLQILKDSLLAGSLEVLDAARSFSEIEPTDTQPPQEWIERFGLEAAQRRFRVARYALMTPKEAPVGLSMALKIGLGILGHQAKQPVTNNVINISKIQMTAPVPRYPEQLEE